MTSDPHDVQLQPSQVWNCCEVGFDPNGRWECIVCNYKWYNISRIWCSQSGEHAPFWCSLLIFSRADEKCFITPVIIHQSATLTYDLACSILGDWNVHATTSDYMDRDGWPKAISHFRTTSGSMPQNRQVIYLTDMNPTTMSINLIWWYPTSSRHSSRRKEAPEMISPMITTQTPPLKKCIQRKM